MIVTQANRPGGSNDTGGQPVSARGRVAGWLQNLLLLFASLTFVLVLCEVGLRFLFPAGGQPKIFDFDPVLGHRMRPNVDIVQVWPGHENVSRIRTNSRGFRGPEIPPSKHSEEVRILLLGDSYTFGFGVDEEDTFAHHLREAFDPGMTNQPRVTVINAGVSAYGTAQELLHYETVGRKLLPDVVILNFFVGNDIQNNLCLEVPWLRPDRQAPCFKVENGRLGNYDPPLPPGGRRAGQVSWFRRLVSWCKSSQLYKLTLQRAVGLMTTNPDVAILLYRLGLDVGPGYLPHIVAGWYQQPVEEQGLLIVPGSRSHGAGPRDDRRVDPEVGRNAP